MTDENCFSVYMHVFPNGKRYFGITSKDPEKRWLGGRGYSRKTQAKLVNAILKYGWVNITHIVLLQGLSRESAENAERFLIENNSTTDLRLGYNRTNGGEGPLRWTPEMRAKARAAALGRSPSASTREKLRLSSTGRLVTKETLAKCSELKKAFYSKRENVLALREANRHRFKPVRKLSLSGEEIGVMPSVVLAAESVGLPSTRISDISRAANRGAEGRPNSSAGFKWEWVRGVK